MKKYGLHIVGVSLLLSLPVAAAVSYKRKDYDCRSDKKLVDMTAKNGQPISEYVATVTDLQDGRLQLIAKRNYILNKQLKTQVLTNEKILPEVTGDYLLVQGQEWALAVAPAKKRASLYNMDPDINEVPMFCLSQ